MKFTHLIQPWIKHKDLVAGFTDKSIGNMSFRTGDPRDIQRRRDIVMAEIGIKWSDVISLPLTHSNKVLSVSASDKIIKDANQNYVSGGHVFVGSNPITHYRQDWQAGIDSIVTDIHGLYPVILSGDCAAVAMFDPTRGIIAMAHVGTIGAVNNIILNTIDCMTAEYYSKKSDIEVVIFPSIRKCHYNIKESNAWKEISASLGNGSNSLLAEDGTFDLQGLIVQQLLSSGILSENIYDTGLCTAHDGERFFSNYLAKTSEAKKFEGRHLAVVGMR